MPSSGCVPGLLEVVEHAELDPPRLRVEPDAAHARLVERVEHLAVDVELELLARRVADPHRARALVAGEPRQLVLRQPPLAGDAVHDLDVGRIARDRPQQPASPGDRLLVVVALEEGEQRERRVAQPAVAVVPVAHRADPLGQRGRRRRDDAARRLVGERLEHDERATHDRGARGRQARPRTAPLHSRQKLSVSASACSGSIGSGTSSCDGNQVRTKGTRSPSSTENSETVRMSSPRVSAGVRKQSASGPAMATRVSSSCVRLRTHGTTRP